MKAEKSLKITAILSLAGTLFSGYFTFSEVILGACPLGGCALLFGVPTCAYGFAMFALIFLASCFGMEK